MACKQRFWTVMSICSRSNILKFLHLEQIINWLNNWIFISRRWTNVLMWESGSFCETHFTHFLCCFWAATLCSNQFLEMFFSFYSSSITKKSLNYCLDRGRGTIRSAKSGLITERLLNLKLSALYRVLETSIYNLSKTILFVTGSGLVLDGKSVKFFEILIIL